MRLFQCFVIAIFTFNLLSCASSNGLEMTEFNKWEEKTFVESGLKCELPVQNNFRGGYYIRELATPKAVAGLGFKQIWIRLHPISAGGYLAEPNYLVDIEILRLEKEKYVKYTHGDSPVVSNDIFRKNNEKFHREIEEYKIKAIGIHGYDKDDMLILRKDYETPNGDYILSGASINLSSGIPSFPSQEDIDAVKRILNAVSSLK
jgi:hypothetical protein